MDELSNVLLAQFRTALSPFLLLTSCATLVWALQARYSRVVQRFRSLSGAQDSITPARRADVLARLRLRAWMLRNSVAAHYLAMMCFLLSVVLLSLTTLTRWSFPGLSVAAFISGLILICFALLNTALETFRSFEDIQAELE